MHHKDFFNEKSLGRNSFTQVVKTVCSAERISGDGIEGWMNTHGLRGNLILYIFESGYADNFVSNKTGHRDLSSLKSYQHLRDGEGKRQKRDIADDTDQVNSKRSCIRALADPL